MKSLKDIARYFKRRTQVRSKLSQALDESKRIAHEEFSVAEEAVIQSAEISRKLVESMKQLSNPANQAGGEVGEITAKVVSELEACFSILDQETTEFLNSQRANLSQFNIALFGRTMSG